MFWSEGRFERGEGFASHEEFFARLERLSRRFQNDGKDEHVQAELERVWHELNDRFVIGERGRCDALTSVGMHLDGERASLRSSNSPAPPACG